jgi:hypothetical protein
VRLSNIWIPVLNHAKNRPQIVRHRFEASGSAAIPALADDDSADFSGFNRRGNILIADQFNNRVIEVTLPVTLSGRSGSGQPPSRRTLSSAVTTRSAWGVSP